MSLVKCFFWSLACFRVASVQDWIYLKIEFTWSRRRRSPRRVCWFHFKYIHRWRWRVANAETMAWKKYNLNINLHLTGGGLFGLFQIFNFFFVFFRIFSSVFAYYNLYYFVFFYPTRRVERTYNTTSSQIVWHSIHWSVCNSEDKMFFY